MHTPVGAGRVFLLRFLLVGYSIPSVSVVAIFPGLKDVQKTSIRRSTWLRRFEDSSPSENTGRFCQMFVISAMCTGNGNKFRGESSRYANRVVWCGCIALRHSLFLFLPLLTMGSVRSLGGSCCSSWCFVVLVGFLAHPPRWKKFEGWNRGNAIGSIHTCFRG